MQEGNHPPAKWRNVVFGCVALIVVLVDQLSKTWIRANLHENQSLFDAGFFQIIRINNTGAAFGIFRGHSPTLAVIASIGVVAILLLVFVWRHRWSFLDSLLVRAGIGLILGGTIGNLIDRIRLGQVTDFINFKIWPAFNVADSAVTIGVIIIASSIILHA
ncbi:MAG: signal peptidase II, partial [Chloroflexi bacterium RBG_16_50_9]